MVGITIPTFVTAPILTLIFGVYGVHLFGYDISLPVGGWNGGAVANMILPVIGAGAAADRDHRAARARPWSKCCARTTSAPRAPRACPTT
jgi:hypothetical protein